MFDVTLLILLGLAALGFISHNTTVAVSILVLIIVRVTPLNTFFPWIEKQGLTVGIIIPDYRRHGADRQRFAASLYAHSLLRQLEITGCHRHWRLRLLAGRARRYADGKPATAGRGFTGGDRYWALRCSGACRSARFIAAGLDVADYWEAVSPAR